MFFHLLSVYCCCCLANVSLPGIGVSVPELRPFFYINVVDIAALQTEMSYVACEFLIKPFLFHNNQQCNNCSTVCLANIYFCFYRIMLIIIL